MPNTSAASNKPTPSPCGAHRTHRRASEPGFCRSCMVCRDGKGGVRNSVRGCAARSRPDAPRTPQWTWRGPCRSQSHQGGATKICSLKSLRRMRLLIERRTEARAAAMRSPGSRFRARSEGPEQRLCRTYRVDVRVTPPHTTSRPVHSDIGPSGATVGVGPALVPPRRAASGANVCSNLLESIASQR